MLAQVLLAKQYIIRRMNSYFLTVLFFGFILGIAVGSFFDFGYAFPIFSLVLSLILFAYSWHSTGSRNIFMFSLFFIALATGLFRTEVEKYRYENVLAEQEGKQITLVGVITELPDARETNMRLIIEPEGTNETLLVVTDLYPVRHYGNKISVSGKIQPIRNLPSSGTHFDYKQYLGKDGIFHEIFYPNITLISSGNGNWLLQKLFAFREKFSDKIRNNIKEPEAALALGELLGEKHAMPASLLDVFKRAGIIHVVVLSGYNITLVILFVMFIFSFLPILPRSILGAVGVILFVLMTGGGASSIRAAVMSLIALLGLATGRTYDSGRALFAAGFIMLLLNPTLLVFDPSFELSFLATFGLIYFTPHISRYLRKVRPDGFRELLSQTLSTQIAVLPLLVYLSGMISVVALLVNILVLPTVPLAMLGSFVTGILGFVSQTVAAPAAFVTYLVLSYSVLIAEYLSSFSFSVVKTGAVSAWLMVFSYLIIILFYLMANKNAIIKKQF